ncbi:hypothetical protein VNO80_28965 [Phaseolus coccineus]|uniref:Uncharacterized protein n=1 Tax=Phaseolus coccineus TaxID=3886 RepID=A0AAN9LBC1_PHACN
MRRPEEPGPPEYPGGSCSGPPSVLGNFFNGLCSTISSCFYLVCCCWLLQDCFGAPPEPPPIGVAPPQAPPLPPPAAPEPFRPPSPLTAPIGPPEWPPSGPPGSPRGSPPGLPPPY